MLETKPKSDKRWKDSDKQAYSVWRGIINRCYNPKAVNYASYGGSGVIVSKEWLSFQNFECWYIRERGRYEPGEVLHVDKDILNNGEKVYSEDTCVLIPAKINLCHSTHFAARLIYKYLMYLYQYKDVLDTRVLRAVAMKIQETYFYLGCQDDDEVLRFVNTILRAHGTKHIEIEYVEYESGSHYCPRLVDNE